MSSRQARTRGGGRAAIVVEPEFIVVAKSGHLDAFAHDGRHLWVQPLTGMGLGAKAIAFPGNVRAGGGPASSDAVGTGTTARSSPRRWR